MRWGLGQMAMYSIESDFELIHLSKKMAINQRHSVVYYPDSNFDWLLRYLPNYSPIIQLSITTHLSPALPLIATVILNFTLPPPVLIIIHLKLGLAAHFHLVVDC